MTKEIFRVSVGKTNVVAELVFSNTDLQKFQVYLQTHGVPGYMMLRQGIYQGLLKSHGREFRYIFTRLVDNNMSVVSLRDEGEDLYEDTFVKTAMKELLDETGSEEVDAAATVVKRYVNAINRSFLLENAKRG